MVTQELPISSPSLLDPQPELLLLDSVADTLVLLLQLDLLLLDLVEPEPGLDMGLELALESVLVLAMVLVMELEVLVLALVLVMELELEAWWLSPMEQLSLLKSQLSLPHDLNTLLQLLPARVD